MASPNTMPGAGKDTALKPDIDALLPSDLLAEDERVVFALKPSLWSVVFLSFRLVLISLLLALGVTFWGGAWPLDGLRTYGIVACGMIALGRIGFAFLQWFSRTYVLTNQRVIRMRGVFTIDIFQCNLTRLQNTFLTMTLAQRLLGLGHIAFTTAGTSGVEAIWRHISHPLEIHQQLIRAINAASNQQVDGV